MKSWSKTPEATAAAFDRAVPNAPAVVRKKMFGYPAAFVNGNMFAGTFRDDIVVRLAEADRATLLRTAGAKPFEPMPGRPMKEYVAVPRGFVTKPGDLSRWVERAHAYAAKLPAKGAKPAAKPTKAKNAKATKPKKK